jgi:hypothetical protein
MRERIYYQSINQIALYEKANKMYNQCRDDTTDNLVKTAKTILKPSPEEFKQYFDQF